MSKELRDGAGFRRGHAIQARREAISVDYPIGQLCQSVADLRVLYAAMDTLEYLECAKDAAGQVC